MNTGIVIIDITQLSELLTHMHAFLAWTSLPTAHHICMCIYPHVCITTLLDRYAKPFKDVQVKLRGQRGIEPRTSRTQSENHATRPLSHSMTRKAVNTILPITRRGFQGVHVTKLSPVGFEPTPPKRLRPERSALDRSAKETTVDA